MGCGPSAADTAKAAAASAAKPAVWTLHVGGDVDETVVVNSRATGHRVTGLILHRLNLGRWVTPDEMTLVFADQPVVGSLKAAGVCDGADLELYGIAAAHPAAYKRTWWLRWRQPPRPKPPVEM
jgi:hypothetical protein